MHLSGPLPCAEPLLMVLLHEPLCLRPVAGYPEALAACLDSPFACNRAQRVCQPPPELLKCAHQTSPQREDSDMRSVWDYTWIWYAWLLAYQLRCSD